jgi:hypothetical protein
MNETTYQHGKPKYVVGNLFELIPNHGPETQTPPVVIPHICNDLGGWGSGFVVPLGKLYPEAEAAYRRWHSHRFDSSAGPWSNYFELGNVQIVICDTTTIPGVAVTPGMSDSTTRKQAIVANMIAQHGTVTRPMDDDPNRPPVRYTALAACMSKVANYIAHLPQGTAIHAPKFGAGLAGGNWDLIEELIREEWLDRGIPVTIYSLD